MHQSINKTQTEAKVTKWKPSLCKHSETGLSEATALFWHREEGRADRGQEMRLWHVVEHSPEGQSSCVSADLQSRDWVGHMRRDQKS